MKPFELIVFDWDGTLADSIGQIVASIDHAIAVTGFPARSTEEIQEIIGLGLVESLVALFPQADPSTFGAFAQAYRDHWVANARDDLRLFDGAANLLRNLAADGYQLAVATGKSRHGLDHALTQAGVTELISASRCADETESKPAPDMLLEILDELNLAPGAALMIGDSVHDLGMAERAGVPSVGVLSGVHDAQRLRKHSPVAVLEWATDLPQWLSACA